MIASPLPVLETARLTLGPSSPEEAAAVFAFEQRCMETPGALCFVPRSPAKTVEEVRVRLDKHDQLSRQDRSLFAWQLRLHGDDAIIGYAAFVRCNHQDRRSEVAYMVEPAHWGKGLAVEATTRVLAYGWNELGLHRVEAHIDPDNAASIRTAVKLGFALEGHLRENHFMEGRYYDTMIYAKLADTLADVT